MSQAHRQKSNTPREESDDQLTEEELEPFRNLAEYLDDDDPVGEFCRSVVANHSSDNSEAN